jgi:anhydro-N-acetylmuramic acid kinase
MTLNFTSVGVMSGTSLDGVDMACCSFDYKDETWSYELIKAQTIIYDQHWKNLLSNAFNMSGSDLSKLHASYGKLLGQEIRKFISENNLRTNLISSHGHTVFHNPREGYTLQIGDGSSIAAITGIETVCDLRTTDVAMGGQGAPLVPIGDKFLFGGHKFCLNLGGISNVSYDEDDKRKAFDICPVNMALNHIAARKGQEFDIGGELAMLGSLDNTLLSKLNNLPFYNEKGPKSLGREWFEQNFLPLIDNTSYKAEDILHTLAVHIAMKISEVLPESPGTTMLVTGGGAHNSFLVETIEEHVSRKGIHVVIPDKNIIDYKEAVIFAFLGVLRKNNIPNALSSVTGARRDSVGGCIYSGK